MKKLNALICLFVSIFVISNHAFGDSSSSSAGSGSGGNFTASDAAYAEVSALTYEALRQAAVTLNERLGKNDTYLVMDRETMDSQIALASATAQLTNLNFEFCSALNPPKPKTGAKPGLPVHGDEAAAMTYTLDVGSTLSGIAAVAQLFTPHGTYASTSINADDIALESDLLGIRTDKLVVPNLYFPPTSLIAPDIDAAKDPCKYSYDNGVGPDAPKDFPTLWLMAQKSLQSSTAIEKPSKKLAAVIAAYNDMLKAYLTPQEKSGSVYSQMLRAVSLKRAIHDIEAEQKTPIVFIQFGVDVMGGTTSESGKTSFTSKTLFSGGAVIHYIAWRNAADQPMHVVSAGTITKTLTNQKLDNSKTSDMAPLLNTN
jgi:hypothetical protein